METSSPTRWESSRNWPPKKRTESSSSSVSLVTQRQTRAYPEPLGGDGSAMINSAASAKIGSKVWRIGAVHPYRMAELHA
jgi:hypothetical protein